MLLPYLKGIPWQRFMDFISPEADRFAILKETLKEAELEYKVTEIAGSRHIIITPPLLAKSIERQPPVILVAHYDRAEGSPGANDNSAGVFLLIETAMKLIKKKKSGWLVIFTDREEIKSGGKLQSQGAYGLAEGLKNLKMEKSKIFSFDACGTGDTLIISTTLESMLKKEGSGEKLRDSILELRKYALDTARNLNMAKVLLVPTPFSDDVGFIRAGLIAQTVTMLPSGECIRLVAELRKKPELAEALINAKMRQGSHLQSIPETWRGLNTPADSHLRLTPEYFSTVAKFAEALCIG
jgi:hypothetical protein